MKTACNTPIVELNEEDWIQSVGEMKRLWNKDGRVHHPIDMVLKCLPFPDMIFIRKEDGWSVGCMNHQKEEVFSLYTSDWEKILVKNRENN